jgi:hypothetical protein
MKTLDRVQLTPKPVLRLCSLSDHTCSHRFHIYIEAGENPFSPEDSEGLGEEE